MGTGEPETLKKVDDWTALYVNHGTQSSPTSASVESTAKNETISVKLTKNKPVFIAASVSALLVVAGVITVITKKKKGR